MTRSEAKPIPLMRFRAGEVRCGLVAAAIERLAAAEADRPQVSDLLGVPRLPGSEQRTLHLFAYGRRACVVVDGPTAITAVSAADLVPTGRSMKWTRRGPVLAFAKDAEQIVLLLDVAWLMERAA